MALLVLCLIFLFSLSPWNAILSQKIRMTFPWWEKVLYALSLLSFIFILFPSWNKEIGEWAREILIFLIFLPILRSVFSSQIAGVLMPYRKTLGILMGTLAVVHVTQYFLEPFIIGYANIYPWEKSFWIQSSLPSYLGVWFIAFIFTFFLLITSNIFSMKLLGTRWKLLHRSVYFIFFFVLAHNMLFLGTFDPILIFTSILFITWKILEWKGIKLRQNPVWI